MAEITAAKTSLAEGEMPGPFGAAESGAIPEVAVTMRINGRPERLQVDTRVTLLDALRDRLGLTGTKKGCDQGACGACTVPVDGKRRLSCLTLAVQCEGREVVTIEGLARNGTRHPVQGGVHPPRRVPVRILHARADHVGDRAAGRGASGQRRGHPGVHERQHLPLRRVRQHRGFVRDALLLSASV
jgi:hypothetical protein